MTSINTTAMSASFMRRMALEIKGKLIVLALFVEAAHDLMKRLHTRDGLEYQD